MEWARKEGAKLTENLSIEVWSDGVRGVRTKRAINADEIVVEIPRKLALEVTTSPSKCPIAELDQQLWKSSEWYQKLGILVSLEMHQGESSQLKEYIAALPKRIPTPLHWSPDQLELLQYPPVVAKVETQRKDWTKFYESFCASFSGGSGSRPSMEEMTHALECVRSRSFSGPYEGSSWASRVRQYVLILGLAAGYVSFGFGEPYQAVNGMLAAFLFVVFRDMLVKQNPNSIRYVLCPVMDMFNHLPTVESEVAYEYFRNTFTLKVKEDVKEGSQVYINYGKRGNDELLQYYGFVQEGSPYDAYIVTDFLRKARQHMPEEVSRNSSILESNELKDSVDSVSIKPQSGVMERSMQAIRILVATDEDLKGRTPLLDFNQCVSDENESKANRLLCAVCKDELDSLQTTLEEDESLLSNLEKARFAEVPEETVLAVKFRIAKKKILRSFIGKYGEDVGTEEQEEGSQQDASEPESLTSASIGDAP